MRIGLLHVDSAIQAGVYQYGLSVIAALVNNDPENEYIVINPGSDVSNLPQGSNIISPPQEGFLFGKVLNKLYAKALDVFPIPIPLLVPFGLTKLGRWNRGGDGPKSLGLDLLICLSSTLEARKMNIPYIMVVHDLMHRYKTSERHPWKERALRDYVFKKGAEEAVLTVVSYERSRIDLHRFYGIPLDKIRIVPEFVPPYINRYKDLSSTEIDTALERFKLPDRYIFYPAQFWRHKNHSRVVHALRWIREEHGVEIPAVFVGAPKEAFEEVMALIERLDLAKQVRYLGYVTDKEMVALYKRATALVMPSLFNVSSIPLVEALVLQTCCLCGNLDPMPEQIGDAGLLFDPSDERDIAEKIWRVWNDEDLRRDLINKGNLLVEERYTPEAFTQQWRDVVGEAMEIQGSGKGLSVTRKVND